MRRMTWARPAESQFAFDPGAAPDAGEGAEEGRRSFPPQPSVPPLLATALALWAACAGAFVGARGCGIGLCLAAAACGLALGGAACAVLWRAKAVLAAAAAVGLALGVACGFCGAAGLHLDEQQALRQSGTWRFEALEDASAGTYGYSCLARTCIEGAGTVQVIVRFSGDFEEYPRYGDVFEAAATLTSVSETSAAYRWRQGVAAQATVYSFEAVARNDLLGAITAVRNRAIDLIANTGGGEGAAVLAALVCGWREDLDASDVYDDFKVCGLAHLVAVSGAHLSIVAAAVAALLGALRVPRRASIVVQAALLLSYLVLAAVPASAIRAAVMTFAGILSFVARRKSALLSALAVCIVGFIALDPAASVSVSFALSTLSTLGIVLFSGLFAAWVRRAVPVLPSSLRDAVSLTLASSVMSTPLSAALFAQLPLVAPLANALTAPLFPLVCAGGLAAVVASLLLPAASAVLIGAACAASSLLVGLVSLLAQIPYASIPAELPVVAALVISAMCAAALWFFWPKPRLPIALGVAGAGALAAAVLVVAVPLLAGTQIVMLDVGQGDAFLVRSGGVAVLIDTGNQDTMLRSALARHGVTHLDAVVITHSDDDHMGSLASLDGIVQVDSVLVASDALSCGCDSCEELLEAASGLVGEDNVVSVSVGDELGVGRVAMEVVWPQSYTDEGGNADSLCLVARADMDQDGEGDWTALFVGDVEADQLEELVESGAVGEVDIYKVGHHGSKNALTEELAQALSPTIALVSVGENNTYGHPAEVTIEALEEAGAAIYCSDEEGDVSCKLTAGGIRVTTQG